MEAPESSKPPWQPKVLLGALAVNAVFWVTLFAYFLRNAYPAGILLGIMAFCVCVGISSIGMGMVHLLVGRRQLACWLRGVAYVAPSVMMIVIGLLVPGPAEKPNQRRESISPSGQYRLTVPIEQDRWRVTIHDSEGNVEYKDEDSDFVGWLNVYWSWDQNGRVWLYNSDDGSVHFWEQVNGAWIKSAWTNGMRSTSGQEIVPPATLTPR